MKLISITALIAAGIALSGCASIVEGTTQSVAITSPPTDGARCTLTNSEGTWYVTTPGNAQVHKTKTNLKVACTKEGFDDAAVTIEPHFNDVTFSGGMIGASFDAATGANYSYPEIISVPMAPKAAANSSTPTSQAPATTASTKPAS